MFTKDGASSGNWRFRDGDEDQVAADGATETKGLPSDDDLWRMQLSYYQNELEIQAASRRMMALHEDMYDGDQWPAGDKAFVEARGQMALTYNVVAPAVSWMLGTERRNRTQYKVLARLKAGTTEAERKSQLMKYLDDVDHSEMVWSAAFAESVKAGISWVECGQQDITDGESVYERHETWRNIIHDSRAVKPDLSDARYLFRTKWVDLDTANGMFPKHGVMLMQSATNHFEQTIAETDDLGDEAMDAIETASEANFAESMSDGRYVRQRVRLIESWFRLLVPAKIMRGGQFSGEIYDEFSEAHWLELAEGKAVIGEKKVMRVHVAIFCSHGMLSVSPSPYRHNKFPFTPLIGNRKSSDGTFYGMIKGMFDIQLSVNKRAAKALHILNTNKVIMDEGAVDDVDALAEEVARPDSILIVKPGKRLELAVDRDLADSHMGLFSRDVDMIQSLSGVTDESMGRTTNATSGKAIIARQSQGAMATAHYFDNLRFARAIHGEKKLTLVEQFMSEEKSFRITNSRGTPDYVTVNSPDDPTSAITRMKADFVISEEDWNATLRQAQVSELLALLQQLAPTAPQIVMVLLDLVVETMDIPSKDEIVARIRMLTQMEDPDADPNSQDPASMARKQAKAEAQAKEQRAADATLRLAEATAAEKEASVARSRMETIKGAQSVGDAHVATAQKAVQAAAEMVASRPIVSVADRLIAQAEAKAMAAMRGAAMAQAQAQPAPPDGGMPTPENQMV